MRRFSWTKFKLQYPNSDDGGQHDLFTAHSQRVHYREQWKQWKQWKHWYAQQLELLSNHAAFVRLAALTLRNVLSAEQPASTLYAPEQSLLHLVYHQLAGDALASERREDVSD